VPTATLTRTTFVHIGADTADPTGGLIGTGLALIGGAAGIGVERTYGCVGIDALSVARSYRSAARLFQSDPESWRARATIQDDKADNFTEPTSEMTHRLGARVA